MARACGLCKKEISKIANLIVHIRKVHKIYSYCQEHKKKLKTPKEHLDHKKNSHKALICTICDKAYSNRSNLKSHIQSIHGKSKLNNKRAKKPCNDCKKSFRNLTRHKQNCGKNEPQICTTCGRDFKSKKARLCHQKTIHEIEKKCEICGEVCIDQNILQIHKDNLHSIENSHENFDIDTQIENSTQAQLYECDICARTYASTIEMKIHVRSIHNSVKKHELVSE